VKSSNHAQESVGSEKEKPRDQLGHEALPHAARKSHTTTAICIKFSLLVLLVCGGAAPRFGSAQSLCESCEVHIGLGGTYHYWGTTGSYVLPVTVTWSENRYELGVFRFTDQQLLRLPGTHYDRHAADPYWGISLSRRWQLFERGRVKGLVGFGVAGRSESDTLSATRWDFASQLELRFRLPGNRAIADLTVRHWSNGGVRLPNHGQDFATLTIQLNSSLFGVPRDDQIAIDPSFNLERSLAANGSAAQGQLLP
jgi:hypothetical protein